MKRHVGLHPLAALGLTAVLAGSVFAATNILTNGGFEAPNPFVDWTTVTNVQTRQFPNSVAPGQALTGQVAEVSTQSGTLGVLVSKTFNPGISSVVMRLSGYYARSPELNTGSATPVSGQNQAVVRIVSNDTLNGDKHVAFLVHSQAKFGTVSATNLQWRPFDLFFRTNGGPNTIKILGVASSNPQGPAGRGILLDGLNLRVISN